MTPQEIENENLEILNFKHLPIFERISKIVNILDNRLDDDLKKLTNLPNYRKELAFIIKYCNFDQYIKLNDSTDKLKLNLFIKRYNIPVLFETENEPLYAIFDVEKPLIIFKDKVGSSVIDIEDMVRSLNELGEKPFGLNIALRKYKINNVIGKQIEFHFKRDFNV